MFLSFRLAVLWTATQNSKCQGAAYAGKPRQKTVQDSSGTHEGRDDWRETMGHWQRDMQRCSSRKRGCSTTRLTSALHASGRRGFSDSSRKYTSCRRSCGFFLPSFAVKAVLARQKTRDWRKESMVAKLAMSGTKGLGSSSRAEKASGGREACIPGLMVEMSTTDYP